MEWYITEVYKKVKAYIVNNGFQEVVVAQKAGIPEICFIAMMDGKRTMYADDLRAICLALNVSPEVFIGVSSNQLVAKV